MGEKADRIKEIINNALKRMHEDLLARYYRDGIDGYLDEVLELYDNGELGSEALYYIIMGIAYEYSVPLSPREVKQLRRILEIEF